MGSPQHRGLDAEDTRLFGPEALPTLRQAAADVVWLLGRGYPISSVLRLVGEHFQLESRQRMALQRSLCSETERVFRLSRAMEPEHVRGKTLRIDGFNLLITLEVALGGGLVLEGYDGVLRDLAGLRGTYRPVLETKPAIDLIGRSLLELEPHKMHWYLDSPVSNSGRLKTIIYEVAQHWGVPCEVELVTNPDTVLATQEAVISSDSLVINRCQSWLNAAHWLVQKHLPQAWRVELCPETLPSTS